MTEKLEEKVKSAKETIEEALKRYENVGVACSFGKDSMVTVDIAKGVEPGIEVFSIMTRFMPEDTFTHAVEMNEELELDTDVYIVSEDTPTVLENSGLKVNLLEQDEFKRRAEEIEEDGEPIYKAEPDECCRLLKVEPMDYAIEDLNLDAWISGLRNTESSTREDKNSFERRENSVKVNPILDFEEEDILGYLKEREIALHPWYEKEINGKTYRSLGCSPCTEPVSEEDAERRGRWSWSDKTECGIHEKD